MAIAQGNYDRAAEIVKDTADDWADAQQLKIDLFETKAAFARQDKSEEVRRYENEITYERGLMEQGYVHIPDMATHDKLVKDLNVTADTYSQYFYKDPASPRIYLRPQTTGENVSNLQSKYPDAGIELTDTFAVASAKLSSSRIYQKEVKQIGSGGSGVTTTTLAKDFFSKDKLLSGSRNANMTVVAFGNLTVDEANKFLEEITDKDIKQAIRTDINENNVNFDTIVTTLKDQGKDPDDFADEIEDAVVAQIARMVAENKTEKEIRKVLNDQGIDDIYEGGVSDFKDEINKAPNKVGRFIKKIIK